MTGTKPAAWKDPTRAGEVARRQFDRGADAVYAAAGATGLGVLQAAKDKGRARDRDRLRPEPFSPLRSASMVKRVDLPSSRPSRPRGRDWKSGVRDLGVAEAASVTRWTSTTAA